MPRGCDPIWLPYRFAVFSVGSRFRDDTLSVDGKDFSVTATVVVRER